MKITLEQVDQVIDRTGVSYAEAKEALENTDGDILDAIIFIENKIRETKVEDSRETAESIEDIKIWLKDIINKGNVSRIKILKDENVIVDVPVNAGIAAGVIAIIIPAILAFGVIAAVVTKVTIEITMADGSVEVVNKYIYQAINDAKNKTSDIADKVKNTVVDIDVNNISTKIKNTISDINIADTNKNINKNKQEEESTIFRYTVNFDNE